MDVGGSSTSCFYVYLSTIKVVKMLGLSQQISAIVQELRVHGLNF